MGKRISFTMSKDRVTFSNRSGGSFSIPVRTETAAENKTTGQHDAPEQRRRMTYAEWCTAVENRRRQDAADG